MNTKKVGRKPIPVIYKKVIYNDKEYIVGTVTSLNNIQTKFVFDADDELKIISNNWCITSVGYVSSHTKINNIDRQLLLHNVIMNRDTFPGRGAKETVDHINRNPLDNRKENLRILTQTEQNINQSIRKRHIIKLPENCEIDPDTIPKHIWYIKPNGLHGDRFGIDFKTENIKWKTTSSKKISLKDKLNDAKLKLNEFYHVYPYLNPNLEEKIVKEIELNNSFNTIINL